MRNPNEERPAETIPARYLTTYSIVSVEADYLVVSPFNGDQTTVNTKIKRYVLKPWTLRKSPFHGKTINGITYTYTSNSQRTAASGATSETQLITQDYYVGAKIQVALFSPKAELVGGPGDGRYTALIDANVDARAWAVQ